MRFDSYAQNFEDIMLYRALKEVERGFYVDVGANDPLNNSVTRSFYEIGWRGINIEPVYSLFEKLVRYRPNDINLQIAMSDRVGQCDFWEIITNTGLSTLDYKIAEKHKREYGLLSNNYIVKVDTLTNICKKFLVREIHFLKIDVEGWENLTIKGLDLKRIRPWIILIESTAPMSQEPIYQIWEPLILENGYHFIYFDGLNRFYLANEHSELDVRFSSPPNVFDNFEIKSEDHWLIRSEIEEKKRLEMILQKILSSQL